MIRRAFIDTLCDVAAKDDRIWLVCGDLGFNLLEKFALRFPERFINAGIAEQHMIGMASGLASCGKIVFIYSIANFPTMRCLEQIRNDVCLHQANVKIVTTAGGFIYGTQGVTHQVVEDLAVMRAMPFMSIACASDAAQASALTETAAFLSGPAYLRFGKGETKAVYTDRRSFLPGKMVELKGGKDVLLIATGPVLVNVLEAADVLAQRGFSVAVWDSPWVKPIDEEALSKAALCYRLIVTVEDAHVNGGLGGVVAEVVSSVGASRALVRRLGITDRYMRGTSQTQSSAWAEFSLNTEGIIKAVEEAYAA